MIVKMLPGSMLASSTNKTFADLILAALGESGVIGETVHKYV